MELRIDRVSKKYKSGKEAVKNVSCSFTNGVYGLLGPNGAGKSTLMNMITRNIKPTGGEISLDGTEIGGLGAKYRGLLGYMPQQQERYTEFTGDRFLWYMASLKGLDKKNAASEVDRVLDIVGLKSERHKKIKTYSGGMKQRILLAQALIGEPKILILDEPTAGLDPKERVRLRNHLSDISKGKIIIIATHVVSDIEYISNEVIIMRDGEFIRKNPPALLLKEMKHKVFEVTVNSEQKKIYEEDNYKIVASTLTSDGNVMRIVSDEPPGHGDIREVPPCLEDLYLYLE